jgi:hypothetical protein
MLTQQILSLGFKCFHNYFDVLKIIDTLVATDNRRIKIIWWSDPQITGRLLDGLSFQNYGVGVLFKLWVSISYAQLSTINL